MYIGIYFGISAIRTFKRLVLSLPYNISYGINETVDDVRIVGKIGEHIVTLDNKMIDNNIFTTPDNLVLGVEGDYEKRVGLQLLRFRVHYPMATGFPYDKQVLFPPYSTESQKVFLPEIEQFELQVANYAQGFSPDLSRTHPAPDVVSSDEMQWITGEGSRPHSSVQVAFEDVAVLENERDAAFRRGVWLAIWLSVASATGLDTLGRRSAPAT